MVVARLNSGVGKESKLPRTLDIIGAIVFFLGIPISFLIDDPFGFGFLIFTPFFAIIGVIFFLLASVIRNRQTGRKFSQIVKIIIMIMLVLLIASWLIGFFFPKVA